MKVLPKALCLYSSRFGQGYRVSRLIEEKCQNYDVELINIEEVNIDHKTIMGHDMIIIVASIRYGYFHKKVREFIQLNRDVLTEKKTLFLPISLVARNPERRTLEKNRYVREFLENNQWVPTNVKIVPGALLYSRYNFFDKHMMKLIMHITKGETDVTKDIDYMDWDALESFVQTL